jgi:hypothetical protein
LLSSGGWQAHPRVPLALAKEQSSGATTLVVDAATAALEADSPYAAERELDEPQSRALQVLNCSSSIEIIEYSAFSRRSSGRCTNLSTWVDRTGQVAAVRSLLLGHDGAAVSAPKNPTPLPVLTTDSNAGHFRYVGA